MDDRKSRILAVFCGITGAAGWVLLKGQGRNQEGLLFILLGSVFQFIGIFKGCIIR